MSSPPPAKRRKPNRRKYMRSTNATSRMALAKAGRGILFSCTPHHENAAFRDATYLLSKYLPTKAKPDSLDAELNELRNDEKPLTRVDGGVQGCVFVKVNATMDLEDIVEKLLREAKELKNPGSKHCIRVLPVHGTCYADKQDAANMAETIVKERFPKIEDNKQVSYAIRFRARLNAGAKRMEYIDEIASRVEKVDKRYKVNLEKPDVTLIVEVLKTSCCIGVFKLFYELGKMNLREVACPTKEQKEETVGDMGNANEEKRDVGKPEELAGEKTNKEDAGTDGVVKTDVKQVKEEQSRGKEEGELEEKEDDKDKDDEKPSKCEELNNESVKPHNNVQLQSETH